MFSPVHLLFLTVFLGGSSLNAGPVDIFKSIDKEDVFALRTYLKGGGDPNLRDSKGRSLLARAAYRGQEEMVGCLLEKGATIDEADDEGMTPLYRASSSGHKGIVHLLSARSKDLNHADNRGITALHIASKKRHAAVVEILCEAGASCSVITDDGKTPLWLASAEGHALTVNCLLQYNAQIVDVADQKGITPLLISSYHDHRDVVRALLSKGADVNRTRDNGISPLIIASYQGHDEVVQILGHAHADVLYRSPVELGGGTAYQYACSQGHTGISEFLQDLLDKRRAQEASRDLAQTQHMLDSLQSMVQALSQKMAEIEVKDHQQTSELDHIKRVQAHFSHLHRQFSQTHTRLEPSISESSELKKLYQKFQELEIKNGRREELIDSLQQEHATLMQDHRAKKENEEQKQALKRHPSVKVFYETLERTLNELFLSYKVLNTGMFQQTQKGKLAGAATGINLLGSAIPLPFASLVTSAISAGIMKFHERIEQRHVRFVAKLVINTTTIDTESEKAARHLAHLYKNQLTHLSPKGSQTLAECGVARFVEYMREERVSDELDLAPQLASSVVLVNLYQGTFPFTHKPIETISPKTPAWTEKGVYQKTGIMTPQGYRYAHPSYHKEVSHYGFREGTHEEAEAFGYQRLD